MEVKKMTLKNLKRALIRAVYEVKQSKLTNNRDVLVIKHDYFGPYPTTETWNVVEDLRKRAARAGLTAEARGHYTATFIY
jgi:hypothetical protein